MPDADVTAAVAGDRAAFLRLVRRHDRRLRSLASKLLGGDRDLMDDVLQDAYLRAFRALASFREDADVGTWLYRITWNACLDELRRSARRPVPIDLTNWIHGVPAPAHDITVADADVLRRALAALPADQRVVVLLVDGEDLDHDTAAAILGVAPGTIASRLSRARHALRQLIGEDR